MIILVCVIGPSIYMFQPQLLKYVNQRIVFLLIKNNAEKILIFLVRLLQQIISIFIVDLIQMHLTNGRNILMKFILVEIIVQYVVYSRN
jgi:hypothetical protein